ncbi:hypothetical protein KY358_01385 [Candidatus Woesearchaeota archaeon]|nr:hypothetical protein [Candidatus Woesearchaeota archaeon]
MHKLLKSKKGIAVDDLASFLFGVCGIVAIVLFLGVRSRTKDKADHILIRGKLNNLKAEQKMIEILETRVESGGEMKSFSELIVDSFNKDNYHELEKKATEIFESDYYNLKIYDESKRQEVEKGKKTYLTLESIGFKVQISSTEGIISSDAGYSRAITPNPDRGVPLIGVDLTHGTGRNLTKYEKTLKELGESSGP